MNQWYIQSQSGNADWITVGSTYADTAEEAAKNWFKPRLGWTNALGPIRVVSPELYFKYEPPTEGRVVQVLKEDLDLE